ncbi:MAG: phage terminase large subunit [Nitrospinae bacterium]|nr:phage terminase large subunit [Nitrospinota bacterium]
MSGSEISPQEAAKELLERRGARSGFGPFCKMIGDVIPVRHQKFLIGKLEDVEGGRIKRLMIFMPPGHAKSTYTSILFSPWFMGRNPTKQIIGASHTSELAESFGRKVRNIVDSEEYQRIFPIQLTWDSKAAGRWGLVQGGEYFGVGVGGSVTGRRADGAIIDDPIRSREDADSETIREKTWEWYRSDLRTRLKPGAFIILIQTRWHEDDLSGRILPENYKGESGLITAKDGEIWEVINFPAIAEEDDILGRSPGEALWPEWFNAKMLQQERISQGERNWSALYQQRPTPETGDYFQRDWVQYYEECPKDLTYYGASDYAVTDDGGDYTVHGVAGVDPDGNIYLVDWWRERTNTEHWINVFIELVRKWHPSKWAEENGQIIKSVGPFIDKRMQETRVYIFREQFTSSTDKATRAQSIRGRMSQGKVFFPHTGWAEKLIHELMRFPVGKYDDQVDVLSLFGRMLGEMASYSSTEEEYMEPMGPDGWMG